MTDIPHARPMEHERDEPLRALIDAVESGGRGVAFAAVRLRG